MYFIVLLTLTELAAGLVAGSGRLWTSALAVQAGLPHVVLLVIATESLPQGVASLLAFNPELSGRDNIDAMTLAARAIKTGEITQAAKDAEMDGVLCRVGQFMGLLDGRLVAVGDEEVEVLTELISHAELEDGSLITLYYGEGVSLDQAEETGDQIIEASPDAELEIVYGGQPLHTYILSIE